MDMLIDLRDRINKELDNFIVKDTYTKGKIAGLRKTLSFIDDIIAEHKEDK